jgi:hypothetical protein
MKTFLVFLINHREALGSFAWIRLDGRKSFTNLTAEGYELLNKHRALSGYNGFSIRKGSKPSTAKSIFTYQETN